MAQRFGSNKVLGLAIGEKSMVIAEASRAGQSPRITLAATFPFPEGATLDTPDPLGQALGAFLKEKGFTARQVVVGVPARWVLSKAKEIPPADASVVADALRLQAEGEFSQELKDLVFDYAGEPSLTESRSVLLVALQQKHLDRVAAVMDSARLQLSAVLPVGIALGAASAMVSGKARSALVVSVGPGGVELSAQEGSQSRVLRHLGGATAPVAMLAGELRRAAVGVANTSTNGSTNGAAAINGNGHGHGPALVLWDGSALNDSARQALADAAGARIEQGNLETLGVPSGLSAASREIAGAAALAIAALSEQPLPVDFLHARLAPPKKSSIPRQKVLLIAAGVAVALLVVYALYDLRNMQNEVTVMQEAAKRRDPEMKAAEAFVTRLGFAQGWQPTEPKFLACMRDLAASIPEDGQTFITSFALRDTTKGTIQGKSSSDQRVLAITDKLKQTKRFTDVKPQFDKRDTGKNGVETTFTIQFTYTGGKPAPVTK